MCVHKMLGSGSFYETGIITEQSSREMERGRERERERLKENGVTDRNAHVHVDHLLFVLLFTC